MFGKKTIFEAIETDILYADINKRASLEGLPEEYDPDFLYVRVRAISAGEYWGPNKNADYFQEAELLDSYSTFLDAHVFKNHDNKDVAKSIGGIVKAFWNNDMKCVELIIKIDRKLAPEIVRGFEKFYTTDVSMGCRVNHTVCSICGNKAKTRAEFCSHVKTQRNTILPDGKRVFEYNIGPRFHDLSIVLTGADRTAKALEIIMSSSGVSSNVKTAHSECEVSSIEKAASIQKEKAPKLFKLAQFQKEIVDKLYVLALLKRMDKKELLSDEILADIAAVSKEAALFGALEFEKEAGLNAGAKHLKNMAIGVTGLAAATNYFQGKRLRGEITSPMENFIADNPGVLPLGYLLAGYPTYLGAKKNISKIKDIAPKLLKRAFDYTELFTKEAEDTLNISTSAEFNFFNNKELEFILKSAYDMDNDLTTLAKIALCAYQAGREDIVDLIKSNNSITDENISTVVEASLDVIEADLEKQASFAQGLLAANLLNTKKIPTGVTAPLLAGSMVDAYLFNKLFYNDVNATKIVGKDIKKQLQ